MKDTQKVITPLMSTSYITDFRYKIFSFFLTILSEAAVLIHILGDDLFLLMKTVQYVHE